MQPKRIIPIDINYMLVEYEQKISPEINLKVNQMLNTIKDSALEGIISIVPTYSSLLIEYDPQKIKVEEMEMKLSELSKNAGTVGEKIIREVIIPVLYGGETGPDLADVARINNLSEREVIDIHKNQIYKVYMLGFNPGFPYMGGLDERLATPRLDEPRTVVPAGSVGIGGEQTGIYSVTSPGGWQLIGHTPLTLFNPKAKDPALLRAGDDIRFREVSLKEYLEIKEQVDNNSYEFDIRLVDKSE